jgi:hypothetical protein
MNGCLIGYIEEELALCLEDAFRVYKSDGTIGEMIEFSYVPKTGLSRNPVFPGIFIST